LGKNTFKIILINGKGRKARGFHDTFGFTAKGKIARSLRRA